MTVIEVPLDLIYDNPFQKRRDYGDVPGLAADIEAHEMLQPVVGRIIFGHGEVVPGEEVAKVCESVGVKGFPRSLRVQLAFGHRRARAFRYLAGDVDQYGLKKAVWSRALTMPVRIEVLDDDQMIDLLWAENQQRSDPNPMEVAEILGEKWRRIRAAGGTQSTLAAQWGLDRSTVANKLRLLRLPTSVKDELRAGRVSERQALALLAALDAQDEAPTIVEVVLADPAAISSDAIRESARAHRREGAGRPRLGLRADARTPMLEYAGGMTPDGAVAWEEVARAARRACEACIGTVGPPLAKVCQQCPGVMVMRVLAKAGGKSEAGEGPAIQRGL